MWADAPGKSTMLPMPETTPIPPRVVPVPAKVLLFSQQPSHAMSLGVGVGAWGVGVQPGVPPLSHNKSGSLGGVGKVNVVAQSMVWEGSLTATLWAVW